MQTFPETRVVMTGIFGDQCVNWNHHLAEVYRHQNDNQTTPSRIIEEETPDFGYVWMSIPQLYWGTIYESTSLSWLNSIVDSKILSWCKSKQTIYVNKHMNLMSPNMITVNPRNRLSERNMLNRIEPLYTWHPSHQTCRAHPMSPETVPCGPAELNPWIET